MSPHTGKSLIDAPTNPVEFFPWLKRASELCWEKIPLNDGIYGFQIQAGTKWNPGLIGNQIADYEAALGFTFPDIFKQYLAVMNGTDKDAVNLYGRSGQPACYAPEYYSFPRDLGTVKEMIAWIYDDCKVSPARVEAEGIPHIIPIVGHRFLVADRCPINPVLSMYGCDIIPYAENLMAFLVDTIFSTSGIEIIQTPDLRVKFWYESDAGE